MSLPPTGRYAAAALLEFGEALLRAAGQPAERAHDIAEVLLEGDLLGHTTHGYTLLAGYLNEITEGRMPCAGEPQVVADHGSACTWEGRYLPGPWLVRRAIAVARERLRAAPLVTMAIRRSHHIACLQAFLKPVTDEGLFILMVSNAPSGKWVVPHGAVQGCYSPNPLAAGIPTDGDPVLIDISMSSTALGPVLRAKQDGVRLPGPWLTDRAGRPTDDPLALLDRGEGGIYPLGGPDLGYKGFALGLLVEALTSALTGGQERADGETRWSNSVFLVLIDPERFGGRAAFLRETSFLTRACRAAQPVPGGPPVRIPGDGALARRAEQLSRGVALHAGILPLLQPWAEKFGLTPPSALG
jgi:L-lactate dehydrogenase